MDYSELDPIIQKWATDRNIPLYTRYKDYEIRSFELASAKGERFQMWVELTEQPGSNIVKVLDFKKRRSEQFCGDAGSLYERLEAAYSLVHSSMNP